MDYNNTTTIHGVVHDIKKRRVYVSFRINPRACQFFVADIVRAACMLSPMRIECIAYHCSAYMYNILFSGGKEWTAAIKIGRTRIAQAQSLRRTKSNTKKMVIRIYHPSSRRPKGVIIGTVQYVQNAQQLS